MPEEAPPIIEEAEEPVKEAEETPAEVEEAEEEAEEEEKAEEEEPDKLSDEEVLNAKNLFKALKNPSTAKEIISVLARNAGLLETKQDVHTASKTIQEVFKESLGPDFAFIAEKLAPAIEKVLLSQKEDYENRLREVRQQQLTAQTESEVEKALSKLNRVTKGESKKFEAAMTHLMDDILPGNRTTTEDYIFKLYRIASSEQSEKRAKEKMTNKINRNANDVTSRLASAAPTDSTKGIKKISLDEAIKYAAQKHKIQL
jgi:hypothetical protein